MNLKPDNNEALTILYMKKYNDFAIRLARAKEAVYDLLKGRMDDLNNDTFLPDLQLQFEKLKSLENYKKELLLLVRAVVPKLPEPYQSCLTRYNQFKHCPSCPIRILCYDLAKDYTSERQQ